MEMEREEPGEEPRGRGQGQPPESEPRKEEEKLTPSKSQKHGHQNRRPGATQTKYGVRGEQAPAGQA